VCITDEVRWEHEPFFGVFVGFRFPDLSPGATIPGLHLHGLDRLRTTGGHNHDLRVRDAVLSVGMSHDVVMSLPERSMTDLLETPRDMRSAQREMLRAGSVTLSQLAAALQVDEFEARRRLEWLSDRGYAVAEDSAPEQSDAASQRWRTSLRAPASRASGRVADLLESL